MFFGREIAKQINNSNIEGDPSDLAKKAATIAVREWQNKKVAEESCDRIAEDIERYIKEKLKKIKEEKNKAKNGEL